MLAAEVHRENQSALRKTLRAFIERTGIAVEFSSAIQPGTLRR